MSGVAHEGADLEVYLTGTTVDAVLGLLQDEIGPLELDSYLDACQALYNAGDAEVMLQAQVEEGLIGLWLKGPLPWRTDIELARLLSSRLHCTARCRPGADYPAERAETGEEAPVYLQIADGSESFVEWG